MLLLIKNAAQAIRNIREEHDQWKRNQRGKN